MSVIKIYDPNSDKERDVTDIKVVSYDEYNADGDLEKMKVVEFVVQGANKTWPSFVPLDKFVEANPSVQLN